MSEKITYKPLRIVAIFAHPDDAEVKMGGTAAKFAELGHSVKFVSLCNGDCGHHQQGGGVLAERRRKESREAARRLGVEEYIILDNHDGEIIPALHIRHQVIREIRKWNADIVVGLRPNDYHPDHRYAGILVMDAAYLVIVPNVVSDTPALNKNPVFLYMEDGFKKPNPFSPDITVAVDDTFEKKVDGIEAHQSQFFEWVPYSEMVGVSPEVREERMAELIPEDREGRRKFIVDWVDNWNSVMYENLSGDMQKSLEKWYGKEKAKQINRFESFEITEYGHQPTDDEIRQLFPMLGK